MPDEQLRALLVNDRAFDHLPVAVVRFDSRFHIKYANHAYGEHLGLPVDQLIGRTMPELPVDVPEESVRTFAEAATRVFASGRPEECSFELTRPVGYRNVHAILIPEPHSDSLLCVGTDVTAFRRAVAARQETEDFYRSFMDAAPSVAWMKDEDGRYRYLSGAYQRLVGADPGWIGKLDADVWPADVARQFRANDERVLQSGRGEHVTETAPHADGTTHTWLSVKFPFADSTGRRFVGGVAVDITEQLRAEAEVRAAEDQRKFERQMWQTQKLESLGVLAGGIAHDFNNLLTGILGYASLARLELDPAPAALAHLEQIERGAMRAADLCKQMLAYAGKGQVAARPTDLNRLVEEMTGLLGISITKKAVLRFRLTDPLTPVQCDPTQLRQVVMNLITNASDAIGDRSGVITVSTGVIDADAAYLAEVGEFTLPPARYVYLEVSDNGCGMPDEVRARIFEPFFTTKFTGRGLGLSAVVGIVRSHHGAIKVYSQPGVGTTFKVLLPTAGGAAVAEPAPAAAARSAFGRGRAVLVAEDEEEVRVLVRKMLTAVGFEVAVAEHGRAGVDAFRTEPDRFSLVLVDLTMPHLDGADVFREIRTIRKDTPVILMSGFSESDAVSGFEGKGLAGFLRKPFGVRELHEAVFAAVGP